MRFMNLRSALLSYLSNVAEGQFSPSVASNDVYKKHTPLLNCDIVNRAHVDFWVLNQFIFDTLYPQIYPQFLRN
ncbi:hypothetical protein CFELI_08160 [Corynebacterium felinum]|uniref:Uncharacterized protein n=1 Tax=Corynebacterium felinum TaxID=131318 RepID=A0ABU2BB63_9CORY|nr:hypothetical protein [Corynebacterium felinum]WJY95238.1 hypothetical protein CFELI_08160 [Corynebacterium felinum]